MSYNRRYIEKKPCKHKEGCSNMPKVGAGGYCWKHEKEDPAYERKQEKAAVKKDAAKVRALPANAFVDNEAARKFQEQENWFFKIAQEIDKNPFCMECGTFIKPKYYRHASAHIFPKAIFPSVATHPMNRLILGAGCGCHDKTHRLDTFSEMKVFPEAVRRFRLFHKSIIEKHALLDLFIEYANKLP